MAIHNDDDAREFARLISENITLPTPTSDGNYDNIVKNDAGIVESAAGAPTRTPSSGVVSRNTEGGVVIALSVSMLLGIVGLTSLVTVMVMMIVTKNILSSNNQRRQNKQQQRAGADISSSSYTSATEVDTNGVVAPLLNF